MSCTLVFQIFLCTYRYSSLSLFSCLHIPPFLSFIFLFTYPPFPSFNSIQPFLYFSLFPYPPFLFFLFTYPLFSSCWTSGFDSGISFEWPGFNPRGDTTRNIGAIAGGLSYCDSGDPVMIHDCGVYHVQAHADRPT